MCVCYCNVLLQYSLVTGLLLCVCATVMCCYSTVWVQDYCYVCVTVMCCYSTVWVQGHCYVLCYCNVLLQYGSVQGYSYLCVLL